MRSLNPGQGIMVPFPQKINFNIANTHGPIINNAPVKKTLAEKSYTQVTIKVQGLFRQKQAGG